MEAMGGVRNCIILGTGPAGLTAALYLGRAGLKPLLLGGTQHGGQLTTTTDIENFPGFPKGINGTQLVMDMLAQAERFGAETEVDEITKVDFSQRPFKLWAGDRLFEAKTVIVATGARSRMLGLDDEKKFFNKGVHTCAVCDGAWYKGKESVVIGGGDSAMEDATYLSHLCSKVTLIHRRDTLRASKIMQERALQNPHIKFLWNSVPVGLKAAAGSDKVGAVVVENVQTKERSEVPAQAMFLAIGHIPNTDFLKGHIELLETGYVKIREKQMTSVPGVFAAGDCHDSRYRQAITAAGMGCQAALEVERFLNEN
ncbi:MAG: thioredoxin-disulfide reductase [Planctomycetota bacterium]